MCYEEFFDKAGHILLQRKNIIEISVPVGSVNIDRIGRFDDLILS